MFQLNLHLNLHHHFESVKGTQNLIFFLVRQSVLQLRSKSKSSTGLTTNPVSRGCGAVPTRRAEPGVWSQCAMNYRFNFSKSWAKGWNILWQQRPWLSEPPTGGANLKLLDSKYSGDFRSVERTYRLLRPHGDILSLMGFASPALPKESSHIIYNAQIQVPSQNASVSDTFPQMKTL